MDIIDLITDTYLTILPIVTTALMGYIVWLLQEQQKSKKIEYQKREANSNGTKLILFYMLQRLHTEYMYQGYVTYEQRTQFEEIYDAYHNLGGNSYGTRMWEDIKKLEIRNDVASVSPFIQMLKNSKKENEK